MDFVGGAGKFVCGNYSFAHYTINGRKANIESVEHVCRVRFNKKEPSPFFFSSVFHTIFLFLETIWKPILIPELKNARNRIQRS